MRWTPRDLTELGDALADELPSGAVAPATLDAACTFNDLQAMAVEALHSAAETQAALVNAARALLIANPVFRSKPVGAPHSLAREAQDHAIAAEDALRAAIARAEPQPQTEKVS